MIKIALRPEPGTYNATVRQPGQKFLSSNPAPSGRDFKRHAYWNRAANDLYSEYSGICAYTSMHMVYPETIDHFKPKSKYPNLAYEWNNLRLCRGWVNVSKGDNEHVLDPFEVENTWFKLELPSCLIKAAPGLSHEIKVKVNNTVNTLRLNSDDSLVQERCNILIAYARNQISQAFLAERYPFLAFQVAHQGVEPRLQAIFKV